MNHTAKAYESVLIGGGLNATQDAARPLQPSASTILQACSTGPRPETCPPVMMGRIIIHPVWSSGLFVRLQIHHRPVTKAHNTRELSCAGKRVPEAPGGGEIKTVVSSQKSVVSSGEVAA